MSELFDPRPSPLSLLPSLDRRRSPYDLAVLVLVGSHLLFTLASAAFAFHFHLRSVLIPSSSAPCPSLRRRLRCILRLNSLWPVRLLLLLFASLLSLSELLRLPVGRPYLCDAYALASQSFAQPAFFATLLFLLRASSNRAKPSPALSFVSAFATAIVVSSPFLIAHSLFLFLWPWALRRMQLPHDFLASALTSNAAGRCTNPIYATVLVSLFAALYVPMFISACWAAVNVVINKKLRVRLFALAAVVIASLSAQVVSLSAASLWAPTHSSSQGLAIVSFGCVLASVAFGEGILVVQPVIDALAIVEPEGRPPPACVGSQEGEDGECCIVEMV